MSSEASLQRAVAQLFRTAGWIVVRTPAGKVYGASGKHVQMAPEGWPDLACFGPHGRVVLVECKRRGGRMRAGQALVLGELVAMDHEVAVVRSVEDASAVLRAPVGTREIAHDVV